MEAVASQGRSRRRDAQEERRLFTRQTPDAHYIPPPPKVAIYLLIDYSDTEPSTQFLGHTSRISTPHSPQ